MIYEEVESPFSDGKALLHKRSAKLPFRKSEFEITEHYYVCQETKEEFTTSDLDKVNLNQVYNQYRERFGIPFPDQIRNIREKYDLSAAKMSEILGLGTNSYRLYEQGEIPSVGNGRLIMAAKDPYEFRDFLVMSKGVIGEREFEKVDKTIGKIVEKEEQGSAYKAQVEDIFNKLVPDQYTGYRLPNLEKISHMILFFSSNSNTWITKLNKLLFYCDFLAFENSGFGISGLDYRAIPYGPSPSKYDAIYALIGKGELLRIKHDELGSYEGHYFEPLLTFNELLFEPFEIEIMEKVSGEFKFFNAKEIKNLSHKEPAWIENQESRDLISYKKYAFTLQGV